MIVNSEILILFISIINTDKVSCKKIQKFEKTFKKSVLFFSLYNNTII